MSSIVSTSSLMDLLLEIKNLTGIEVVGMKETFFHDSTFIITVKEKMLRREPKS